MSSTRSWGLAAALAAAASMCIVGCLDGLLVPETSQQSLVVFASAAIHGGLAWVVVPLAGLCVELFQRVAPRLRQTKVRWGVVGFGLGALSVAVPGAIAYVWLRGIILSAINYRPVALVAVGLVAGVFIFGCVLVFVASRTKCAVLLAGVLVLHGAMSLVGLSIAGSEVETLSKQGATSKHPSRLLLRAFDGDNDGFPSRLCTIACDCDDSTSSIYPGAVEKPNNGIDEDCFDGDLVVEIKPPTPTAPTPTPLKAPDIVPPNILLITVDTLRADRLGSYGYTRDTSPNLDALAARSALFEQARSGGCMTRYGVPSLMSGRYVSELERTADDWTHIHKSNTMMAEVFKDAGYHTAAFHSIDFLKRQFGLDQGFDVYDLSVLDAASPVNNNPTSHLVTDAVLSHFDTAKPKKPWLVWAYYADPHARYLSHTSLPRFGYTMPDIYDQEILFTDLHIGRLLEGLKSRQLLENTIVAITSDHGEGLDLKHDRYLYHGASLYDSEIRVPLIIHAPGMEPRRVKRSVGNIDLFPTLLELTQTPKPTDLLLQGVSLVPYLKGLNPPHPPVFSEKASSKGWPHKAMIAWPYKVIWNLATNRFYLYNVETDPKEREPLNFTEPEKLAELKQDFQVWRSTVLKEVKAKGKRIKRTRAGVKPNPNTP